MKQASDAQGAISIKGQTRAGSGATFGYAVTCTGNAIYSDDARIHSGIWVAAEQVLVANNYVEGTLSSGIHSSPNETLNDINITGNTLKNIRGSIGIELEHDGSGLIIADNIIKSILDTEANASCEGIRFQTYNGGGDLTDIQVQNNQVTITNATTTAQAYGVQFATSGTPKHVLISGNIFNIACTGISGDNHGVAFLGTGNVS
jgi:hypothetical protein